MALYKCVVVDQTLVDCISSKQNFEAFILLANIAVILNLSTQLAVILRRLLIGVVASGGGLYVIGGRSGCRDLSLGECYNADTVTWRPIAALNVGRSQAAVCELEDGRIIAAGGCGAWNCTNSVEIYNPAADKWSLFAPSLAVARRGAGIALFRGQSCCVFIQQLKLLLHFALSVM